MEYLKTHNEP